MKSEGRGVSSAVFPVGEISIVGNAIVSLPGKTYEDDVFQKTAVM
jgi:hypothetical protein